MEPTIDKLDLGALKSRAQKEAKIVYEEWNQEKDPLIADIGANIGYYSEAFLKIFSESTVYAYEIHPKNLLHLKKITNSRLVVREYGLLDKDSVVSIGLPVEGRITTGHYSIHYSDFSIEGIVKNANKEEIRPDIVKIDVEGSESLILTCSDFFTNTKIILIEILKADPFNQNELNFSLLSDLGFSYKTNTSKNNQMWIKK